MYVRQWVHSTLTELAIVTVMHCQLVCECFSMNKIMNEGTESVCMHMDNLRA